MPWPVAHKYRPFPPVQLKDREWPNRRIESAPIWCSVDLRDGNQALAIPMNIEEKIEMFKLLCDLGFKEIEVGFPSASKIEYEFVRRLIEEDLIPEGVTIQALTQAREHLISATVDSLQGARSAILHVYNATNPTMREITFGLDKPAIKQIAIDAIELIRKHATRLTGTRLRLEYSPEHFSDTELDFSLEICTAVMDAWRGFNEEKIILNLPATVEVSTPNIYADQIEYFCRHLPRREEAVISLHTHNDRGTGIAATELGLMAGADRVEGTLFGNGERTGNVDIVVLALNMVTQGVEPGLRFDNIPELRATYERCTRMDVPQRWAYSGDLVFTAFSGSHQDAIKKGFDAHKKSQPGDPWRVPYIAIDPADIGRTYEAIIRINSQSGKGGVAFVLAKDYGFELPKLMHPEIGRIVNALADAEGRELTSEEIYHLFQGEYILNRSPLDLISYEVEHRKDTPGQVQFTGEVRYNGETLEIKGKGNGPINAFVNAMADEAWKNFQLIDYRQHAIGRGSATNSAAYIQIRHTSGRDYFGCGINPNIELAGLQALVSAFNRATRAEADRA
jgi:2-isopropylmalate synthase